MLLFPDSVSHDVLVVAARNWLRKAKRCSIVVSEIACMGMESPDALGWHGRTTHLVECKTSRSDFLADRKKFFRQHLASGMGDYRYFLTVPGVIREPSELPQGFGWLELQGSKIKVVTPASPQSEKSVNYETYCLLSLIRRLGQSAPQGCSIRCYTHETKNRAAVDIDLPPEMRDSTRAEGDEPDTV